MYFPTNSFRRLEQLVREYVVESCQAFALCSPGAGWMLGFSDDSINEYTDFLLSKEFIPLDRFVANIIFLLYRDRYLDYNARLKFNEHYGQITFHDNPEYDSTRKLFERNIERTRKRKEGDFNRLHITPSYLETITTPIKQQENPKAYYYLSAIDMKAVSEYGSDRKREIIALLKNGKILDTKNVSKKRISTAYEDLFNYIEMSSGLKDSQQWIETLIDISIIESSCMPVFLFAVARYMEQHIKEPAVAKYLDKNAAQKVPPSLMVLCASMNIVITVIQSRFLYDRNHLISRFFFESEDETSRDADILFHGFADLLIIHGRAFINSERDAEINNILKAVCTDSVSEAYEYFHERYDLLADYSTLDFGKAEIWTDDLVRLLRNAVIELSDDGAKYAAEHPAKPRG